MAVQHRGRHLAVAVVGGGDRHARSRRAGWSCSRRRRSGGRADRRGRRAPAAPRRSSRRDSRAATGRRARPVSWSAYDAQRVVGGQVCGAAAAPGRAGVRRAARPSGRSPPVSGNSKSSSQSRSRSGMSTRRRPDAAAPSGVSCDGQQGVGELVGRDPDRPPLELRRGCARRARPAGRVPRGRLSSSTPCTRLPKVAPDGSAAIGDGSAGSARSMSAASRASSLRSRCGHWAPTPSDPGSRRPRCSLRPRARRSRRPAAPARGSARSRTCDATRCRPRGRRRGQPSRPGAEVCAVGSLVRDLGELRRRGRRARRASRAPARRSRRHGRPAGRGRRADPAGGRRAAGGGRRAGCWRSAPTR